MALLGVGVLVFLRACLMVDIRWQMVLVLGWMVVY